MCSCGVWDVGRGESGQTGMGEEGEEERALEPVSHNCPEDSLEALAKWPMSSSSRPYLTFRQVKHKTAGP